MKWKTLADRKSDNNNKNKKQQNNINNNNVPGSKKLRGYFLFIST